MKQNNSSWVLEQYENWLTSAIKSTEQLCDYCPTESTEYTRLLSKNRTLTMALDKLRQLKFER